MIFASCHCGSVILRLPRKPRVITECNCSACRRLKPLFAYYARRTVQVQARTDAMDSYVWGSGTLRWFRCKNCGCFTHHEAARTKKLDPRTGVNLRMVDPCLLAGITVQLRDGAADTWALLRRYRYDPERD